MAENEVKKVGFGSKVKRFFKDVKGEITKIRWADLKETLHKFYIVLIVVAVLAIALWGMDWLFNTFFTSWLPALFS